MKRLLILSTVILLSFLSCNDQGPPPEPKSLEQALKELKYSSKFFEALHIDPNEYMERISGEIVIVTKGPYTCLVTRQSNDIWCERTTNHHD